MRQEKAEQIQNFKETDEVSLETKRSMDSNDNPHISKKLDLKKLAFILNEEDE